MAADVTISTGGGQGAPLDYPVPGAVELVLKQLKASYNGASAAGAFVPTVQLLTASGVEVGSWTASQALAAGASADVTWFPGVSSEAATSAGSLTPFYNVLLAASAPSFDIVGIPANGGSLAFITYLRSDEAGVINTEAKVTVNGLSTGSGISYEYWDSRGFTDQSGTSESVFGANGAGSDSGHYSGSWFIMPNYSVIAQDHQFAGYVAKLGQFSDTTSWQTYVVAMQCCIDPGIAVNRVTITPTTAGANWVAGSRVTMYLL